VSLTFHDQVTRVPLLRGGEFVVNATDAPLVESRVWRMSSNGYVTTGGGIVLVHRLITRAAQRTLVDHIDGDRLNNRRSNLRVVDQQRNQANRKRRDPRNTSGARGVSRKGPRWRAWIGVNGKQIHLGMFDTIEGAATARRAAEIRYWGENAPMV
jgi:hypothetical protein